MRRSLVLIACLSLTVALAWATASAVSAFGATASAAWVWPVEGDVITPYRNGSDPYASGQHRGIDIAGAVGTPVAAAAGGEVRFAGTAGSSGLTLSIRTSDGYDTSYLHLSSLAVRAGARVSAGERIGAVGTTGTRSATAPHLHFGVRDAGTRHDYHDPLAFLPPPPPAPAPKPPTPAPARVPEPTGPARVHVLAPAPALARAPIPVLRPRSAPARSPAALRSLPRSARLPSTERSHTAPSERARVQSRVAEPRLDRHPAAGRAASVHPPADARGETRPERSSRSIENGVPGAANRAASSRASQAAQREPASHESDGPSIGWVLACGGLLLAAAILGLRENRGGLRTPGNQRRSRRPGPVCMWRTRPDSAPAPVAPTRVESRRCRTT